MIPKHSDIREKVLTGKWLKDIGYIYHTDIEDNHGKKWRYALFPLRHRFKVHSFIGHYQENKIYLFDTDEKFTEWIKNWKQFTYE